MWASVNSHVSIDPALCRACRPFFTHSRPNNAPPSIDRCVYFFLLLTTYLAYTPTFSILFRSLSQHFPVVFCQTKLSTPRTDVTCPWRVSFKLEGPPKTYPICSDWHPRTASVGLSSCLAALARPVRCSKRVLMKNANAATYTLAMMLPVCPDRARTIDCGGSVCDGKILQSLHQPYRCTLLVQ